MNCNSKQMTLYLIKFIFIIFLTKRLVFCFNSKKKTILTNNREFTFESDGQQNLLPSFTDQKEKDIKIYAIYHDDSCFSKHEYSDLNQKKHQCFIIVDIIYIHFLYYNNHSMIEKNNDINLYNLFVYRVLKGNVSIDILCNRRIEQEGIIFAELDINAIAFIPNFIYHSKSSSNLQDSHQYFYKAPRENYIDFFKQSKWMYAQKRQIYSMNDLDSIYVFQIINKAEKMILNVESNIEENQTCNIIKLNVWNALRVFKYLFWYFFYHGSNHTLNNQKKYIGKISDNQKKVTSNDGLVTVVKKTEEQKKKGNICTKMDNQPSSNGKKHVYSYKKKFSINLEYNMITSDPLYIFIKSSIADFVAESAENTQCILEDSRFISPNIYFYHFNFQDFYIDHIWDIENFISFEKNHLSFLEEIKIQNIASETSLGFFKELKAAETLLNEISRTENNYFAHFSIDFDHFFMFVKLKSPNSNRSNKQTKKLLFISHPKKKNFWVLHANSFYIERFFTQIIIEMCVNDWIKKNESIFKCREIRYFHMNYILNKIYTAINDNSSILKCNDIPEIFVSTDFLEFFENLIHSYKIFNHLIFYQDSKNHDNNSISEIFGALIFVADIYEEDIKDIKDIEGKFNLLSLKNHVKTYKPKEFEGEADYKRLVERLTVEFSL